MCCGILEWAQSWSFLGEKVALVCECLDWAALLAVCLLVVRQTTCYKSFDRCDVSVCTCVCIQETMKEREKETKVSDSRDGREAWFTGVTAVWMNAWVHVHRVWGHKCRPMHGGRKDVVKETSASPSTRLLRKDVGGQSSFLAVTVHDCPSSTRLLGFKKVQSQTLTAAVPLECLYIPVMLWFFCTPAGLYKAVLINHKNVSNLLKYVPVTIFRRPVLPCKMIWFSSFVTSAFIFMEEKLDHCHRRLEYYTIHQCFLRQHNVAKLHTDSSRTLWKMSRTVLSDVQKVFPYRFLKNS